MSGQAGQAGQAGQVHMIFMVEQLIPYKKYGPAWVVNGLSCSLKTALLFPRHLWVFSQAHVSCFSGGAPAAAEGSSHLADLPALAPRPSWLHPL